MLSFDEVIADLKSTVCRCGRTKEAKQSFCRDCYFKLPNKMRRTLYLRMGKAYDRAYSRAVAFLGLQR